MQVAPGLCGRCTWARQVSTARGSGFVRCGRSDSDPGYPRYPALPVRHCEGFRRSEGSHHSRAPAAPAGPPLRVPQQWLIRAVGDPPPQRLFERVGGRGAVERIIDALYHRIEADPELRPLFPEDLSAGRAKQQLFFEQWLGGEPRYTERYGSPRLRGRHLRFPISRRAAEGWLEHMSAALQRCAVDPAAAREIMDGLRPLALHFVNQSDSLAQPGSASPD